MEERPSGLRAVAALIRYRPNTGPDDLAGVSRMPHTIQRLGMARPSAPRPSRAADLVRVGFQMIARDLDQLVAVLSSGWRKLAAENDARMASIDARFAALVKAHHDFAAAQDAELLAEAYAEGGTEQVDMLTPSLLAQMDARAKQVAA